MGVTHNDLKEFTEQRSARLQETFRHRAEPIIATARRAQTVVDHPGWQTFLDHLDALKRNAEQARDGLVQQMYNGDVVGDALTKHSLKLRELSGVIKAYETAMALIPDLIKRADELPA